MLGTQTSDNQQPSLISRTKSRDEEGSETTCNSKEVQARALRISGIPNYLTSGNDDIVRTVGIKKNKKLQNVG